MATDLSHKPNGPTVDLTGLPESVVREVNRLVEEARKQQAGGTAAGEPGPAAVPAFISDPGPTPEQARQLLEEMASMGTGKALPPGFSRADIYDDHD